jgi:hypothetical protein
VAVIRTKTESWSVSTGMVMIAEARKNVALAEGNTAKRQRLLKASQ